MTEFKPGEKVRCYGRDDKGDFYNGEQGDFVNLDLIGSCRVQINGQRRSFHVNQLRRKRKPKDIWLVVYGKEVTFFTDERSAMLYKTANDLKQAKVVHFREVR